MYVCVYVCMYIGRRLAKTPEQILFAFIAHLGITPLTVSSLSLSLSTSLLPSYDYLLRCLLHLNTQGTTSAEHMKQDLDVFKVRKRITREGEDFSNRMMLIERKGGRAGGAEADRVESDR